MAIIWRRHKGKLWSHINDQSGLIEGGRGWSGVKGGDGVSRDGSGTRPALPRHALGTVVSNVKGLNENALMLRTMKWNDDKSFLLTML